MASPEMDIVYLYITLKYLNLNDVELHKIQNQYMHIFFSRIIGPVASPEMGYCITLKYLNMSD